MGGGGACDAGEFRTHLERRQGRFNPFAGDEDVVGTDVAKTNAIGWGSRRTRRSPRSKSEKAGNASTGWRTSLVRRSLAICG